jgi:hypothetical protein
MALVLIAFYLLMPVMGFAHVDVPDAGVANFSTIGAVAGTPCDHCPCSDEQGSRCCDSSCCGCAFHSPSDQGVQLSYTPDVIIARLGEPFVMLPQVYYSIIVPPQNRTSGN